MRISNGKQRSDKAANAMPMKNSLNFNGWINVPAPNPA
jgi:hypothetical protein